jgi:hypothetical protein
LFKNCVWIFRDQCYDFQRVFAKKFAKIGNYLHKILAVYGENNIGLKTPFFR